MKKSSLPWVKRVGVTLAVTVAAVALGRVAMSKPDMGSAAQGWPNGPVTFVVTFPPGGGTDTLARRLADRLHQQLGQPFVVENRAGASGNIGAQTVARAPADGHTVLVANSSYAINPAVFSEVGFDPVYDLKGVINVAWVPSVIVTSASSSWTDLKSALKAHGISVASCGNGTPQHLAAGMLNQRTGANWLHVPYKGCGPALIDVLAGTVDLGVVTASSALPHIQAGTLRALAVTSPQRSGLLPDTPTVAESGVEGYELNQWHGLLVPAATPPAVVKAMHAAIQEVLDEESMRRQLVAMGYDLASDDPQRFQQQIWQDIERFAAAAKSLGLKAN